ncbi:MAG: ABC transporter ATP-binding protein, partial [Bifidobacterium crudilactis]|nr:ABC transporter ATP-binding protein [Bifidobacterium crudilactis]
MQKKGQTGKIIKRLLKYLLASKIRVIIMVISGMISVGLVALGPKILGKATNVLFSGILGTMLQKQGVPAGTPTEQVVAALRAQGNGYLADMIASQNDKARQGKHWSPIGTILLIVIAIYLVSILLRLVQNFLMTRVVSDAVFRMRAQIEDKMSRLPLQYFDRTPRGEVMSRTTNDVDNISQTLQQILGELFFSVFMVVATFIMMLSISPMLTLVAFIIIPVMGLCAAFIMKKTQPNFIAQWAKTGEVNSHVEEMFSGHMIVRSYGRQDAAKEEFDKRNRQLYDASFKASFLSSLVTPVTTFFGNLSFVLVVIFGCVKVLSGTLSLGDMQSLT